MRITPVRFPWIRLVLVALLATAAPVALAVEAWQAGRRHREAAERALRDYARSAAVAYRQQYIPLFYFAVDHIFQPVSRGSGATAERLPDPAALREAAEVVPRCPDCYPRFRPAYFFRLMLADSTFLVEGPPLSAARRAELVARLPPLGELDGPQPWYTSIVDTLGPEPEVVYLTLRRDRAGTPVAVYGFGVELTQVVSTALRPLLDRIGLVPVPHPATVPNDSLLSLTIQDPGGRPVLELSPHRYPTLYAITIPASRFLGNWRLHLALNPGAAPPFLIGGLPPGRALPLALLVLVTAVLVGLTVYTAWRAHQLARLRADFLTSVSHELRTPLAQIQLFGESLALGRMHSRQDVRGAGQVIVGEARRLLQLVENVLLFNRRRRSGPIPRLEPQPLVPLVRETVERFAPLAAASAARLRTVRLDPVSAPADPAALRQVLLNLLDNAAKYGPREQTISVGLALLDGQARIWVEDEGPGIPPADRTRVWEPFVRLPRELDSHIAGSGIGLALVRELVQLHGGSVRIDATPTGGTCIVVELPGATAAKDTPVSVEEPCES